MAVKTARTKTKSVKKKPATKTVVREVIKPQGLRPMLDLIEEFLLSSPEARQLWDVMSALRGPDAHGADTDKRYTVRVRRAAFPIIARRADAGVYFFGMLFKGKEAATDQDRAKVVYESHFDSHIVRAEEALGIRQ